MRWIVLTVAILSSGTADGSSDGTAASDVPDPLPGGYMSCVQAVFAPSMETDEIVETFSAPIGEKEARLLNKIRRQAIVSLRHCPETDT